jgi:predicted SnoaL-like aldol condensation-catalyzing enzyme
MPPKPVQVTLDFIKKINQGDVSGLAKLLAPDHTFVDLAGDVETGKENLAAGWCEYLGNCPNYRIYIRQLFAKGDEVIVVGHTTGSHLGLPDEDEFHNEAVIWAATVEDGLLSAWKLYNDTVETRLKLGLEDADAIYTPGEMAATIAKHLDLLPPGARTDDVRNVRKYYSRLYRKAPPETMVAIAESLYFDQGYWFVPYELIRYHPGAIASLTPAQVEGLGERLHDWASTDVFSMCISGPAWKQGVIDDETVEKWIHSPVLWWRRAAVVSTIYYEGDPERMLRYTEMLIDDKEDLIVKALSWVLRRAIRYDRAGVARFLAEHDGRLAARIKREVRNKLDTGLKNP